MIHQKLVEVIAQELYQDSNVSALILYGSVSRKEETANSDIDLLVIVSENQLQKRHVVREGITIEFVEMHIGFLQNFIEKKETPILSALSHGKLLFSKTTQLEQLIAEAKEILEKGPSRNPRWENEEYRIFKRSELTEIYLDLLDVEDEVSFHYITALFIANTLPLLLENYGVWPQTRKKMIQHLKSNCAEGYAHIETLLKSNCTLQEKRLAAKSLVNYTLKQDGGILEGDAVIFRKDHF